MDLVIKKWGNSLAVRIPKKIAELSDIHQNSKVQVEVEDKKLILKPVKGRKLKLEDLLLKITPKNLHSEVDTGSPRGREVW